MKRLFRADQVGSLLRPPELLAARERRDPELPTVEDRAIAAAIRQQEEVGLPVVTDGEFRRENWYAHFVGALAGVRIEDGTNPAFAQTAERTVRYVPKNVMTVAPLRRPAPILVEDFRFVAERTTRTAKITLPSPSRLHFHGGRHVVSRAAYPELEAFFGDVVRVYREELAALEDAGCRYVQIDDPLLSYFISETMREQIRADGEIPEQRLARYVRLVNDCIAARRPETAVGIHVCRGNARSAWLAAGGYEPIAEAVLGGLDADHFLLEYDDERSGDFRPLRFVPPGKGVVLGLVTTKRGALERRDDLLRRVEEATAYVPLERLALSPQCGFASVVEGNVIGEAEQWAKLRLVVETAAEVWPAG